MFRRAPTDTSNSGTSQLATALWMLSLPRKITVHEHVNAKARIEAAREKFTMVNFGGGGPTKVYTGAVNIDDYLLRDGHPVVMQFDGMARIDRFGWVEGHADSPARLYE